MKGYYCPKAVTHAPSVYCKKWQQDEKIPTVWSMIKKHSAGIPSPDKYTGQPKKFGRGKFFSSKSKKVTEFEEIIKAAKKTPAPNSYKIKALPVGTKMPVLKCARITFIDDIKVEKKSIPGVGHYKANHNVNKPRTKCMPFSKVKKTLMDKYKQTSAPSPQTYEVTNADGLTMKRN